MSYSFHTVELKDTSNSTQSLGNLGLPATFNCALMSLWVEVPAGGNTIQWGDGIGASLGFNADIAPDQIFIEIDAASGLQIGHGVATVSLTPGDMVNFLVSADGPNNRIQVYINDAPITLTETWFRNPQIGRPATMLLGISGTETSSPSCVGDLWFSNQASFTDLTDSANRRKFIGADLTPVDVGANGETPFGSPPPVFLHLDAADSTPADYIINLGTGGSFDTVLPFGACAVFPTPTPPATELAELADLWFGPTSGFIDLRATSARRKFIGLDGSTAYLGANGELPFGTSPPVFLSLRDALSADHFADNEGSGGAFAVTGGDLATGGSGPPCGTYDIAAATLPNTPQGADPQIMLSVSDDGGRTFSLLQKWRSLGKIGEYTKRLRWLKMGQFRQRQIRLEITDPVRRNLLGFYLYMSPGLD